MDVAVSRRRFTVDDYHRMGDAGILSPSDRVELIDGEIVSKPVIGPRHAASVDRTTRVLVTAVGTSAIVRVQGAVRLDLFHEPEPDIVLLRPRRDFYATGHPGPTDILLVIEFAESSIDYDRGIKARVYAQSRLIEYWIVDLNEDVVHAHAEPSNGVYRAVTSYRRGRSLAPRSLPSCAIATVDLLGE